MEDRKTKSAIVQSAKDWHVCTPDEVLAHLQGDQRIGLASEEVARRIEAIGPNELREKAPRSPLWMFLDQFTDFMILVLLVAAVISGVLGELKDAIAIMVIVVLNAVIGFVQEFRAERAMAALKRMAAATARVIRDGHLLSVPAPELVPGDIVLLEAGNVVPADIRLLEAAQLRVDEAALTGESVTVFKHTDSLSDRASPLGDRRNMAYKGTIVSSGRGVGVVVATGMQTELGRIASLLGETGDSKTPLQKRLAQFGKRLALAAIAICVIIFVVGVLRGESIILMFLTAVSLAVAAIPEALPAVVTITLALGARKMVKQHALVRRLPAVETLGSVTYICSDKTGTLTQNRMKAEELYAADRIVNDWRSGCSGKPWDLLFRAMALNSDAVRDGQGNVTGDPTETALFQGALVAGYDKTELEETYPRLRELPFDSERKRMTTLHANPDGVFAFVKGAPESILPLCVTVRTEEGIASIDADGILEAAERMAEDGLRVLAFAYRAWPELPDSWDVHSVEKSLTFLGLVGLIDPPRSEAQEAVALCRSAGITPVMITGDHPATAAAIARRLGILADDGKVMTGAELVQLSQVEFDEQVEHIRVYARVDPEQKIKIVRGLQDHGEFVAMTGDGVNDAPALKRADIGVSMGKGGTDVAREASALVLLDDNFATIVSAVREGRRIYDNIRKFIRYGVTTNSAEIWTIFLAPFLGLPIPLLPIHILWINLVTDGLPALALAAEPEEPGIMRRPPRPPRESVFAHGMWQHMVWVGLLMAGITLATQAWAYHHDAAHWQTMVFTVLTLAQLAHILAIRSERESVFRTGFISNGILFGAVMLTFALQMATLYVPLFNDIFRTQPLTLEELVLCVGLSSIVFFAVEIEKWMIRKGWLYRENGVALS